MMGREILSRIEVLKAREYFVYFKLFAQRAGAKDPAQRGMGFSVVTYKQNTFTTLIDHFTSLYAINQLIKLELLTQSIRQQKLPPRHARKFGIRPGCPYGLGPGQTLINVRHRRIDRRLPKTVDILLWILSN